MPPMYLFVYLVLGLLGLILGSYFNSWIWRVHEWRRVWNRRSICVHCEKQLVWYDNIPVISFAWLKGKCRHCHGSIPAHYLLVELATPLFFIAVAVHYFILPEFSAWQFFRDLFFSAFFIVVFMYDYLYFEILPPLMWMASAIAFGINYFFLQISLLSLLFGILIGGGFFLLQYLVSRGRWIGSGDIHLGILLGALLGWEEVLVALFIAYVVGALVGLGLLVTRKKKMQSELPFGTFLAVGGWVAMLWGSQIVAWYVGLIR